MGCPIIIGDWQIAPTVAQSREAARQADYESAMAAIERGRAALAGPLPPPRCEQAWRRAIRRRWNRVFMVRHEARGGRWS